MATQRAAPRTGSGKEATFSEACRYLEASSQDLAALRAAGLIACILRGQRLVYPTGALALTGWLLKLGRTQGWGYATLAWYADLLFAAGIGRIVLLPMQAGDDLPPTSELPGSWLETMHAGALARDAGAKGLALDPQLAPLLKSLLTATLGTGLLWEDEASARRSALGPIIAGYEAQGDAGFFTADHDSTPGSQALALLVFAFATLAPPITPELRQVVQVTYARLHGSLFADVPLEEQERIRREHLIAVDRLYAAKAREIHSPPATPPQVRFGTLTLQKRTIALQLPLPLEQRCASALDNILDIVRPFLGPYGARVVQALYEIANDPPNWRQSMINVDTNALLDKLGEKRDSRGIHYSRNRTRLRDTLNAAHNLEIVGEYTTVEEGVSLRHAVRRPVLSLIGATFDAGQSAGLTTEELFIKGLPRSVQVRLNFYDGVRHPDGTLGAHYVLMPRLAQPGALVKANYAGTFERLHQYLLLRYRQEPGRALCLNRREALEAGGVTNKNVTRATHTLTTALNRLVDAGLLEDFSPVPLGPEDTLVLTYGSRILTPDTGF